MSASVITVAACLAAAAAAAAPDERSRGLTPGRNERGEGTVD